MSAPAPPRGQRLPAPSRHAVLSGAGTLVLVGLAALARTIAERHCGLLGMSSRETVGTRVWLTLPVSGPRSSADDVA